MQIACALFLLIKPEQLFSFSTDSGSLILCLSMVKSSGFNTIPDYIHKNTLNDVTIFHYDSDTDSKMPCPDWVNSTAARQEWNFLDYETQYIRHYINLGFESAVQQFNHTGSLADSNTYQARGCCVLYPNGTSASSLSHTFNGKDFIGFDFDRKTFVAAVSQAVVYKQQRDRDEVSVRNITFTFFKLFSVPEVRLIEKKKKAGSVTVTCHVTGFYPREVQVFWLGSDLQPVDEGVTEILPNDDGTYQTRKSVIVPGEDVGKQNYSCVVLHISVPNNITTVWEVKAGGVAVWIPLLCISLLASVIGIGVWWRCKTRGKKLNYCTIKKYEP
uniref:Ig-like domain-containing protein n=1 Tax=Astyanax mexicanus TaxID=7994 RepID=W5K7L3_ASTMX